MNQFERHSEASKIVKSLQLKRAVFVDGLSDDESVILTIACNGIGTCEVWIPKDSFAPFELWLLACEAVRLAGMDQ